MKIVTAFLGAFVLYSLYFLGGASISGCKKTETVHDIVHDTTIVNHHDTTVVRDTIYDLTDGLVAYYNFNGGNLNDSSGFHNNIVSNNAVATTDRFGNNNNAYLFDGASTFMRVPNSPSLNPDNITLFAIVKVNGFNQANCHANQILGKGYPDYVNGFYNLRINDYSTPCASPPNANNERIGAGFGDNNPQGAQAGVLADTVLAKIGQWYYLTYTYDGITARIYINGQLKNSVQKSVSVTDNSYDLLIGKHEDPPFPYYFNGVIDEVRIYNRALPSGAVKQLSSLKQ